MKKIIEQLNCPIFLTSANKSGNSPCKDISEIEKEFPNLDGILKGKTLFGKSSTIVDCSQNTIKILRKGPISENDINKALKN